MKKQGFTIVELIITIAIIVLIFIIVSASISTHCIDQNSEAYARHFPEQSRALSQRKLVEQNERLIAQQDELIKLKKQEMERER